LKSSKVFVIGSNSAFGSRVVPSEQVDHAFGMPAGKLRHRAGIVSLAYAAKEENEGTLGAQAAAPLMPGGKEKGHGIDWIVAASETHHAYPSLSAILHAAARLAGNLQRARCGSGCWQSCRRWPWPRRCWRLAVARESSWRARMYTAGPCVPGAADGKFGGLFAMAQAHSCFEREAGRDRPAYRLGEFFFGCAAQYAEAISVSDPRPSGGCPDRVQFNGGALSRCRVHRMVKVLHEVERRSGLSRKEAGAFATHQPNPRLVTLLAKQLKGAGKLISTRSQPPAGIWALRPAALSRMLRCNHARATARGSARKPDLPGVSLGPGLLFGGGWMVPRTARLDRFHEARILCHANRAAACHLEGAAPGVYPDWPGRPERSQIGQTMQNFMLRSFGDPHRIASG